MTPRIDLKSFSYEFEILDAQLRMLERLDSGSFSLHDGLQSGRWGRQYKILHRVYRIPFAEWRDDKVGWLYRPNGTGRPEKLYFDADKDKFYYLKENFRGKEYLENV